MKEPPMIKSLQTQSIYWFKSYLKYDIEWLSSYFIYNKHVAKVVSCKLIPSKVPVNGVPQTKLLSTFQIDKVK